uniref:Serine/threonine-protein kinase D1-3-like ubiquitin-like domain-containing protein n=1 Tax=Oncorhynchus tshawytscha TaxID=74940 RepID=A0AAZ3Q2D8_ONCTS
MTFGMVTASCIERWGIDLPRPEHPQCILHTSLALKTYLHSQLPVLPPTPSPSPSPPAPLYSRLSNGSHRSHTHSAPSPTNSRSSFHGVSFLLQIGLTREMVNLENHDLSLSAVKDLVCSIVDQKGSSCVR